MNGELMVEEIVWIAWREASSDRLGSRVRWSKEVARWIDDGQYQRDSTSDVLSPQTNIVLCSTLVMQRYILDRCLPAISNARHPRGKNDTGCQYIFLTWSLILQCGVLIDGHQPDGQFDRPDDRQPARLNATYEQLVFGRWLANTSSQWFIS